MSKLISTRVAALAVLPLILFWFAYNIRADQKRTLVHPSNVNVVTFVDSGKKLAVSEGSMGSLNLWDVPTRKLIRRQDNMSSCQVDDQFFKSGAMYAHFSLDGQMEVRDVRTGKLVRTVDCSKEINVKYGNYEDLSGGILSNSGNVLALTTWRPPNGDSKNFPSLGKLRLWDLETHKLICTIQVTEPPQILKPDDYYVAPAIGSALFAPDDKTVAVGLRDGSVSLWNARSGQLKYRLVGQKNLVVSLAFSPDGQTLASGNTNNAGYGKREQNNIVVWSLKQGKLLHTFNEGVGATALMFSPDEKMIASGDSGDGAALWDLSTGKIARRLNGHSEQISGLAFAPNGKMLATGSCDRKVKLWSLN